MTPESRLRRSLLFVPGDDARKLDRADAAGADTLILDLEDAVAPDRKRRARGEVSGRIGSGAFKASEVAVRINAAGTEYFEADLASVVSAGVGLLMIPKSESAEGIAEVAKAVARLETPDSKTPVRLLALVESARGIVHLSSIAERTSRVEGLCFGNADFSLDMGLADAALSTGVVYQARCNLAIAAVAGRVTPIDGVCLAVKDDEAFRLEASDAARLGFEGKLCIHPSQVPIANRIFTPTEEQIATAQRIVEARDAALASGKSVFSLDGRMVDAPLVAAQERLLARARRAGTLPELRAS